MNENPWIQLPAVPPYVPEIDRPVVDEYNDRVGDDHRLQVQLVPEPYIGRPDAPVVLLGSNAGFTEQDSVAHEDAYARRLSLANLLHGDLDYPFFHLDPALSECSPGHKWWGTRLRALVDAVGLPAVSQNVFYAAWVPYHSCWQGFNGYLPSQEYTFDLVRQAIAREALIVVLRGTARWAESIAELSAYSPRRRLLKVRNPQMPAVSPANLGQEGFDLVVQTLREAGLPPSPDNEGEETLGAR
jgi:hypothetical protein